MKYFKVKPASDQTKTSIVYKRQILVGDELYTAREIEKALQSKSITDAFVQAHFDPIELSPKKTYYFFGARFAVSQ